MPLSENPYHPNEEAIAAEAWEEGYAEGRNDAVLQRLNTILDLLPKETT